MKAGIRFAAAIVGCLTVATAGFAQGSAKLAVGPAAGGYLCPDGRQLYVKSCYSEAQNADCAIVNMHLPPNGKYQVETYDTRSKIIPSIAACKVYSLEFRDGNVYLKAPKQQVAQAPPPAAPAAPSVAAPPAASQYNAGASSGASARTALVRISAGDGDWQYVDELSIRPSSQKGFVEVRQLAVSRAGKPGVAAISGRYLVNCKTMSRSLETVTSLYRTSEIVEIKEGDHVWNAVAKGTVGASVVSAACNPGSLKGLRFPSLSAAIADASTPKDVTAPGPTTALVRISNGNGVVHYVDERSVKPATAEAVGEVWAMQVFTEPSKGMPNGGAAWARYLVRCAPGRTYLSTIVRLDQAGKALSATPLKEDEPAVAPKGSVVEIIAGFACQQSWPKEQRLATVAAAIADAAKPQ